MSWQLLAVIAGAVLGLIAEIIVGQILGSRSAYDRGYRAGDRAGYARGLADGGQAAQHATTPRTGGVLLSGRPGLVDRPVVDPQATAVLPRLDTAVPMDTTATLPRWPL